MSSKLTTLPIVLIAALISQVALAEEAPTVGFDIGVDYVGKYIWRGLNFQDDGAIQPSIGITYGNFTGSVWGSMDMSDYAGNSGEITEVDYSLDYSADLCDGIGYSIGLINYVFPNTDFDDTTEIYAGLSFDTILSPSITIYKDVDEVDGSYVSAGIGHTFENVIGDVPADVSASFGWGSSSYNKAYWGVDSSEMNDFAISVAFPVELQNGWSLTPSLNYVSVMSGDLKDTGVEDDFFYIGIGLAKSF